VNGSGTTVLLVLSWQVEVLFIFGEEFIMAEKLTWLRYKILSTVTDIDNCCKQSLSHVLDNASQDFFLLQHDNAPPHRARVVEDFLQQQQIYQLPWPAYSLDCNPIEHAWDTIDRAVRSRDVQPSNLEEWRNIGQRSINKLVESMPRRIQAVIDSRGGYIKY
jgi:hypothetical protein